MKRFLILLTIALIGLCCAGKKKKEPDESPNIGKDIVLTLTTGDKIQGKIISETAEDITILGKAGEGKFLKWQIIAVAPPEPPKVEAPKPKPPEPVSPPETRPPQYLSIRGKGVFHRPNCPLLRNQPDTKIVKHYTRKEALDDGLKPCGTCNP